MVEFKFFSEKDISAVLKFSSSEKFSIVFFPEGKISETGEFQPLKAGSGLVAVEMGVTVVTIKIEGVQEIFPYGTMLPRRRGGISVTFGKPVLFSKTQSYEEATAVLEDRLKKL